VQYRTGATGASPAVHRAEISPAFAKISNGAQAESRQLLISRAASADPVQCGGYTVAPDHLTLRSCGVFLLWLGVGHARVVTGQQDPQGLQDLSLGVDKRETGNLVFGLGRCVHRPLVVSYDEIPPTQISSNSRIRPHGVSTGQGGNERQA